MTRYKCDKGHEFTHKRAVNVMSFIQNPFSSATLLDLLNTNTPLKIEDDLLCPVCLKIRLFDGLGLCEEIESEEE